MEAKGNEDTEGKKFGYARDVHSAPMKMGMLGFGFGVWSWEVGCASVGWRSGRWA